MGGEEDIRRRRLEGDPALGADDGVAQVDAASDTVRAGEGLEPLDDRDGRVLRPVQARGPAAVKPTVCRSGARGSENASLDRTQALSGMLPDEVKVSLPPMVTPQSPRFTE